MQHCANARAWVAHCNSDLLVVSQTLKVDGALKHKFEASSKMEHRAKRLKALDNYGSFIKNEQKSLTLMGILSDATILDLEQGAKPDGKGT